MNRNLEPARREPPWPVNPYMAPAPSPEPVQAHGLELSGILRILLEWRWVILSAASIGLIVAVVHTLTTTPLYRARATLEVNPPAVEVMDEQSREGGSPAIWDLVTTQVGLLKSRSLAQRTAEELNLANDPQIVDQSLDPATRLKAATGVVAGGLEVTPPEEGTLIQYGYVSESPQLAARIANGIGEAFINSNLQRKYDASAYARKFLERQISKTRGDLERSERKLVAYAQAQGIINTSSGAEGSGPDAGSLQGQSVVALNQALAEATARRVAAEGAYRSAVSAGPTSEVTATTQALRQARAALEAEFQDKRTLMKPDHPEMASLRSRIQELDRQIAREASNVTGSRLNSLQAEYRAAASAEAALQSRVAALKGQVLDLRGRSIQYTILQREVDTNRALYDALLQRYKEIGVAGGVGAAPVSIVDRAEVPGSPFKPNLLFNLMLGLGIGLLGGVGLAFALETLTDTIKTREDVRTKLGLSCLGAIPKQSGRHAFLESLADPMSSISEGYSAVVAALRFSTERGEPKAIMVTSARPSEGKSSTVLALAQNYARRGRSVLLIDADLRKPAFRAPIDRGLTKLLTSNDAVGDHITTTQYDQLCLLPSGPIPPNSADLLSSSRFRQIVREATEQFDMVVIDAPPVVGLADAPLMIEACEDLLLVIEAGKTRTATAQEAMRRLQWAGANIVGAVLTKASEASIGYGYGYGRYGYGQVSRHPTELIALTKQSPEA